MTETVVATRSIIIDRLLSYPPEKVWRALTEGALLGAWLMPGDFQAVVGHRFTFRVDPVPNWNGITEGEVLEVEPYRRLVYSWKTSGAAADGLKTVVTWMLTPTPTGTRLYMEQSGFRPQDEPNYHGATRGWEQFTRRLEGVLDDLNT